VLDGAQHAPPQKGGIATNFRPISVAAKRLDGYATWYGGRPLPRRHCVRWRPSSPPPKKKGIAASQIFGPCVLWPNGCMYQDTTWYGGRPQPRRHCVRRGRTQLPPVKGAQHPPLFGPCLLWPCLPISATAELLIDLLNSGVSVRSSTKSFSDFYVICVCG